MDVNQPEKKMNRQRLKPRGTWSFMPIMFKKASKLLEESIIGISARVVSYSCCRRCPDVHFGFYWYHSSNNVEFQTVGKRKGEAR